VPGVVVPATEIVSALLALPLAGGVTELGTNPQVTPAGWPEHERATALLKPLVDDTVQVLDPLPAWATDRLDGLHETAKSGVGVPAVGVTVAQLLLRPKQAFEAPAGTTL
jgi:hypothetical protein